tara:strand:+ start:909 stop:1967 length:1059 start_codon:yes stop_codon:yes gene_type:complete
MKIRFNQPGKKTPDDDRGVRIQYGEAKRPGRPWRWYLILIVASLPLLYLSGLILQDMIVIKASGRVQVPLVTVRSTSEGYVQQVFVKPLQTVTQGTKLAMLANAPLENSYNRLRSEINFLDKEKDKLLVQADKTASSAVQLMNFAREQRDFYLNRLRQYELLFNQGAATQAESATARSQYASALGNLVSLEGTQLQGRGLMPEIRQIATRINQLTLELDKTQDLRRQLLLTAPANGLITELFAQPGEYLDQGQRLLEIIFPEQAYINAFIPPKYLDYAVVNQIVTVTFPNGETAEARITSVPGVTQKSTADDIGPLEAPRSAILAQIELIDTVRTRLISGMPVDIRFHYFTR